jgi:cell division protein FtsW
MNLSVVVGLIPVTGVTLPFLSYGGSSLLISMSSIGIVLNISKKKNA